MKANKQPLKARINTASEKMLKAVVEDCDIHEIVEQFKDISPRDGRKLGVHLSKIRVCWKMRLIGTNEPCNRILGSIDKVSKLSPTALDGGGKLKQEFINALWTVYGMIETQGTDDSHYMLTDRPQPRTLPIISQADYHQGWVFYKPRNRIERVLKDSRYNDMEDQYALLKAYELFK